MECFSIPDTDKWNVDITTLHYYEWLKTSHIKFVNNIQTKRDYLATLGFVVYENILDPEDVELLSFIEEHYFHIELKPIFASEYEKVKYCNAPCIKHQN